ncbi:MAG: hypothetical protein R8G34_06210 [Paracoccaceae bacterium]|nr:hypothetical protein [Paracoccaceae bacterium]
MKKTFWAALLALAGAATAATAAEVIYDCSASYNSSKGFIGPRVVFFIDTEKAIVRVLDGVVQGTVGAPIEGKLTKRSDKVYRIDWRVINVPTQAGALNVTYRADLNHVAKSYTMEARVGGYDNDARGEGRCKIAG